MLDWSNITGFEWGAGNARKSIDKHSVNQYESEQVFFNQPLLILPDIKHSQEEVRHHALAKTDLIRYLHVTFTLRSNNRLIRVISARDMHRKEKMIYEKVKKNTSI
ncbi:MAG: BrnT family toxin [Marinicella pacifica]